MKLDFGLVQLIISRVSSLFTGAGLWTFLMGVTISQEFNLLLFLCTLGSVKDIV